MQFPIHVRQTCVYASTTCTQQQKRRKVTNLHMSAARIQESAHHSDTRALAQNTTCTKHTRIHTNTRLRNKQQRTPLIHRFENKMPVLLGEAYTGCVLRSVSTGAGRLSVPQNTRVASSAGKGAVLSTCGTCLSGQVLYENALRFLHHWSQKTRTAENSGMSVNRCVCRVCLFCRCGSAVSQCPLADSDANHLLHQCVHPINSHTRGKIYMSSTTSTQICATTF